VPIVLKSGSLNLLEPSGPVKACNGVAFFSIVHHGTPVHLEHLRCSSLDNIAACKTHSSSGAVNVLTEVKSCFANF
jgi:hypothetical protein